MKAGAKNEEWGIYIHVPWCRRRCPYCDFYFEIKRRHPDFAGPALREFHARRSTFPYKPAQTLYFGGGTPSLLEPNEIAAIVAGIQTAHALLPSAEISLEANPEDLNPEYLKALAKTGVNRLSLGAQSLDDRILKWLGRKHTGAQVLDVIENCKSAGIQSISVDLIVGVPTESADEIKEDIAKLAGMGIQHFSLYLLTVEQKTPLERLIQRQFREAPDHDTQADAYIMFQDVMSLHGFRQYEVSSYAKPGFESRHNRLYWSQCPYLGLGPGAHSMVLRADGGVLRRHNKGDLAKWIADPLEALFSEEHLDPDAAYGESLAFGIRDMLNGIQVDQRTADVVAQLLEWQYIVPMAEGRYRLSPLGARFADTASRMFL